MDPLIPTVISLFSLFLAGLSLGWNIYRDVVVKPKLKVNITYGHVTHPTWDEPKKRVCVTVTNFGPGKTKASMLHLRNSSKIKRILKKSKYAILNRDYEDDLCGMIPKELEVGEKVDLSFRLLPNLFLWSKDFDQIGMADPFGKVHWCRRKDYLHAQSELKKHESEPDGSGQ